MPSKTTTTIIRRKDVTAEIAERQRLVSERQQAIANLDAEIGAATEKWAARVDELRSAETVDYEAIVTAESARDLQLGELRTRVDRLVGASQVSGRTWVDREEAVIADLRRLMNNPVADLVVRHLTRSLGAVDGLGTIEVHGITPSQSLDGRGTQPFLTSDLEVTVTGASIPGRWIGAILKEALADLLPFRPTGERTPLHASVMGTGDGSCRLLLDGFVTEFATTPVYDRVTETTQYRIAQPPRGRGEPAPEAEVQAAAEEDKQSRVMREAGYVGTSVGEGNTYVTSGSV